MTQKQKKKMAHARKVAARNRSKFPNRDFPQTTRKTHPLFDSAFFGFLQTVSIAEDDRCRAKLAKCLIPFPVRSRSNNNAPISILRSVNSFNLFHRIYVNLLQMANPTQKFITPSLLNSYY